MGYKIAIIGATNVVGQEIINCLNDSDIEIDEIYALAPKRQSGKEVSFGEKDLIVKPAEGFNFSDVDIVFCTLNKNISKNYILDAATSGAVVIDLGGAFANDPDVPLIVNGVNDDLIKNYKKKNIITCPSAPTNQLASVLAPLHAVGKINRVVISTYQAVSSAGRDGMNELFDQSRKFFVTDGMENTIFDKTIAFNIIPKIDEIMDDGQTYAEWQIASETKKILDKNIKITATCVHVPVFIGHGMSVNIEFENDMDAKTARQLWREIENITVIDVGSEMEYITPAEISGEDGIFISRVRNDQTSDNGLSFWCCADNVRATSALNAINIAKKLTDLL